MTPADYALLGEDQAAQFLITTTSGADGVRVTVTCTWCGTQVIALNDRTGPEDDHVARFVRDEMDLHKLYCAGAMA